jgi:hypothetical protein
MTVAIGSKIHARAKAVCGYISRMRRAPVRMRAQIFEAFKFGLLPGGGMFSDQACKRDFVILWGKSAPNVRTSKGWSDFWQI